MSFIAMLNARERNHLGLSTFEGSTSDPSWKRHLDVNPRTTSSFWSPRPQSMVSLEDAVSPFFANFLIDLYSHFLPRSNFPLNSWRKGIRPFMRCNIGLPPLRWRTGPSLIIAEKIHETNTQIHYSLLTLFTVVFLRITLSAGSMDSIHFSIVYHQQATLLQLYSTYHSLSLHYITGTLSLLAQIIFCMCMYVFLLFGLLGILFAVGVTDIGSWCTSGNYINLRASIDLVEIQCTNAVLASGAHQELAPICYQSACTSRGIH